MKVISIVGARPQFIKCAPLSKELRKNHEEIIIHTGQHYNEEMSAFFFQELKIPAPDINLEIGSGSHGYQTGKMIIEIENFLLKEKPNVVLVYGDTNSTLAGAIAASKIDVNIAHVEAGLRSFDRSMPEEINRVVTDHLSQILLSPSQTAIENLAYEGVIENVHNVGDLMVEAVKNNLKLAERKSTILKDLNLNEKDYIVATVHRASNTDNLDKLNNIMKALAESNTEIILPLHPRTKKSLEACNLLDKYNTSIRFIPPLGYFDMLKLMSKSKKIVTDSGGIQKEAYILNVPCITLRDNTEWIETVEAGSNILVGFNHSKILSAINFFEGDDGDKTIYGKGDASKKICKILENHISSD
ncbi:UDP-N-acetylglucosamine 2-epimerase (non-hydrolyzing) [Methanolobus sp. WCC4]|uniref:non-hydrolyzing UDP-N-acetylglucosamine 2-epimerase n=1 Tax=Methanolobus sp. WCC4 TaxID=3125784 RepID=UPI0030FD1B7C